MKHLWRTFNALNNHELYDILALRQQVFVIEQKCFYNDLDYLDQKAMHLLVKNVNEELIGYLRLFDQDILYPGAVSFGRVLTSPSVRGQRVGKMLIQETLSYLKSQHCKVPIKISAQMYLQKFYESFGFTIVDKPFDDVGITHIKMVKSCDE